MIHSRLFYIGLLGVIFLSTHMSHRLCYARPCQKSNRTLKQMYQQILKTDSITQWNKIYQKASQARSTLQQRQQANLADEGCLLAIQSEAAFYLSASYHNDAVLWNSRALGHLILTQAWFPQLAKDPQWKIRWRTLRTRLFQALQKSRTPKGENSSKNPSSSKKMKYWIQKKGQSWVDIPVLPYDTTLSISPNDAEKWALQCGLSQACQKKMQWRLVIPAHHKYRLYLQWGHYRFTWSGACTKSSMIYHIDKHTSQLDTPKLACSSQLTVYDAHSQKPISDLYAQKFNLTGGSIQLKAAIHKIANPIVIQASQTLILSAVGYFEQQVKIPQDGSPLTVHLQRCPIGVDWHIQPRFLQEKVRRHYIWGQKHSVVLEAKGYQPLTYTFTLPKPSQCEGATFPQYVHLSRKVDFLTYNQEGLRIKLKKLEIGGLDQDSQQESFYRPVGRYRIRAYAEGYQMIEQSYQVQACSHDGTRSCPSSTLTMYFKTPPKKIEKTANTLKNVGWMLMGSSLLVAGYQVLGVSQHNQVSGVDRTQSFNQHLNQWSIASSSILLTGILTYTLGHLWPALSTDDVQ